MDNIINQKKTDRKMLHPCVSLLETTLNTRDLGGYMTDLPDIATQWNRVYRSDRQGHPSERDIDFLKDRGITTITEMRKVYPKGVKKGHVAYALKHDGDKDGWACE